MIFNLTSPGGIYPESAKNGAIRQIVFRLFQSGSHPYIQSSSMVKKKKKKKTLKRIIHTYIHKLFFLMLAKSDSPLSTMLQRCTCVLLFSHYHFNPPPPPARLSLSLTHTYTSTHSHTRTHWAWSWPRVASGYITVIIWSHTSNQHMGHAVVCRGVTWFWPSDLCTVSVAPAPSDVLTHSVKGTHSRWSLSNFWGNGKYPSAFFYFLYPH